MSSSITEKKFETVLYSKTGTIATVTLNNPASRNAWPFPGQGGLTDDYNSAMDIAEEDDDVKVVIIKAAGSAFTAGHDLTKVGFVYGMGTGKEGERRASQRIRLSVDTRFTHTSLRTFFFPKVTIGQVHGYCLGEGIIMVCCFDLAIAAENATFGHVDQRLGFSGSGIPTIPHLILTVGLKRAMDILLTGRKFDAREAERIGLVNKTVPNEKLEEEVQELAKTVGNLPRDGIAIGKAHRHLSYDALGLSDGFTQAYIMHTLFTNLRWEPDEYNFFKQRRDKGVREGYKHRDERYSV